MDIDALLSRDESAWDELVHAVAAGSPPSDADLIMALIDEASFNEWMELARKHLERSDEFFTISAPLNAFRSWLGEGACEVLGPDDPRSWQMRRALITSVATDDGGFAAARALYELMEQGGAAPEDLAEVLLLVAKGAFTIRDYDAARESAARAEQMFEQAESSDRQNFAARRVAAADLYLGRVDEAFARFDDALTRRGPLFGGGGVQVFSAAPDDKSAAVDEARDIAAWASNGTPEWVRAVGGLAERWDDEETSLRLWERYEASLDRLCDGGDPAGDFEVVVRHARQRDMIEVAVRAARRYLDLDPDDAWAAAQLKELISHRELATCRLLLETEPDQAIERLWALFEALRDSGRVAESELGFQVCDVLISALIEQADGRAIEVQRALWDAKLDEWGECPAAWLEEQNLGTVFIELGDQPAGLRMLNSALTKQIEHFGEEHPAVERTRRNISRAEEIE